MKENLSLLLSSSNAVSCQTPFGIWYFQTNSYQQQINGARVDVCTFRIATAFFFSNNNDSPLKRLVFFLLFFVGRAVLLKLAWTRDRQAFYVSWFGMRPKTVLLKKPFFGSHVTTFCYFLNFISFLPVIRNVMAVEYHNRFVAILMGFVIILIKSPLHVCISFRSKILIDTILSPEEFQFDKKKNSHKDCNQWH